jgi:hypothetical protein
MAGAKSMTNMTDENTPELLVIPRDALGLLPADVAIHVQFFNIKRRDFKDCHDDRYEEEYLISMVAMSKIIASALREQS